VTRDEFFLEVLPKHANIAELGVFLAEFSDVILRVNEPRVLDLVDTWPATSFTSGDVNGENPLGISNLEAVYRRLQAKYERFANVYLHRMSSVDFLARGAQRYQCIYIDTVHDYWTTTRELSMGAARLVQGGWLAGHDLDQSGVQQAVEEFRKAHPIKAVLVTSERCPSYFLKLDN
jgi:hypothetical protein